MGRNTIQRGPGPCENCERGQRKPYGIRSGVLKYRPFCDSCYRAGVRRNRVAVANRDGCRFDRPTDLVDTGMTIEDATSTLVHPDGRRESPVPPWVAKECWFGDISHAARGHMKVYRRAKAVA